MKPLVLSLLFFLLGVLGFLNPVRNVIQFIFTPVQFGLANVAQEVKQSAEFVSNISKVHQENLTLLDEVSNLKSTIAVLKIAGEENLILKEQLAIKNKNSFDRNLVIANVMGNASDLSGSTIILDKGSKYGIKKGNNVIKGAYIVGVISHVSSERSIVDLVISPANSMAVKDVDSINKTEGIATGQYGTAVLMKRILPTEAITVGDTILTSGKDGIFEPGLIVGTVKEVIQVPVEPLKSAYIETILDLVKVDRVFVIVD